MEWLGPELHCFAWAVVRSQRTGAVSKARSASFMLPEQIVQLVRQGVELGDADDRVFGRVKSGQGCAAGRAAAAGAAAGGAVGQAPLRSAALLATSWHPSQP